MAIKKFKKLPISALMVIYNEEKVLERALNSFFDIVDEIIIVHDGKCTDDSLEIARKYTDKVFELNHAGESEKHRPFTYQEAKNDWILQLDADEYLSRDLKNNLENLISGDIDIYDVSYSLPFKGKHYFIFTKRALFRKSKVFFIGVAHEGAQPLHDDVKISKTEYVLMHEPLYDNFTFDVFKKKWKKWARSHARELTSDFSSIPKWNCSLTEWDARRKLLIRFPIALGIIGATTYKGIGFFRLFIKHWKYFIIPVGIFSCMYSFCLYYYVWSYKKKRQ
jgi:glycosyltransferase involved in cell wall biosynthesis